MHLKHIILNQAPWTSPGAKGLTTEGVDPSSRVCMHVSCLVSSGSDLLPLLGPWPGGDKLLVRSLPAPVPLQHIQALPTSEVGSALFPLTTQPSSHWLGVLVTGLWAPQGRACA